MTMTILTTTTLLLPPSTPSLCVDTGASLTSILALRDVLVPKTQWMHRLSRQLLQVSKQVSSSTVVVFHIQGVAQAKHSIADMLEERFVHTEVGGRLCQPAAEPGRGLRGKTVHVGRQ